MVHFMNILKVNKINFLIFFRVLNKAEQINAHQNKLHSVNMFSTFILMYTSSMNNYNIIAVSVKINTLHFVNRPIKIVYAGYHS